MGLRSGRSITIEEAAGDRLTVRSPSGTVELSVQFTPKGPLLSFTSADIHMQSTGLVRFDCEGFQVDARAAISMEADDVRMVSRRGDVGIEANDDVCLKGERILLND